VQHRLVLALLVVAFWPSAALAQQMVVFDEVYTAVEKEPGGSSFHHSVKPSPSQPANWVSPVDYSKGTVYIHQEVMTKPSMRTTQIDICFDGDLAGYGCINTAAYTTTGVHETVKPLTSMWQYDKVAWTRKRTVFHLVIKDPALGGTPGGKPASDYVPSTMRIVLTIVPPGGAYVPPTPAAAVDGGGAPEDASVTGGSDARPADSRPPPSAEADAAASPDTARPPMATSPDAAPTTEPTPPPPSPVGRRKAAGCAMGGAPASDLLLVLLAAALLAARQRRRPLRA
jgi:MYXO-CTERM domain-containing protein